MLDMHGSVDALQMPDKQDFSAKILSAIFADAFDDACNHLYWYCLSNP